MVLGIGVWYIVCLLYWFDVNTVVGNRLRGLINVLLKRLIVRDGFSCLKINGSRIAVKNGRKLIFLSRFCAEDHIEPINWNNQESYAMGYLGACCQKPC